jgi:uncharacterized membrane protein
MRNGRKRRGAMTGRSVPLDSRNRREGTMHVMKAITVLRPIAEVYDFWLDFQNLPRFMGHLAAINEEETGRFRWKTKGVDGDTAEWEIELTERVANEMLA